MVDQSAPHLEDTGERMIPTADGEVSVVFSRHRFAYGVARQFATGKEVLDLGCGTGYGCALLGEVASSVLGVDQDADAVAYCRAHFGGPNVQFRQDDATTLESADAFDLAVSFQVIEHVRDTDDFVRRLKRAVRPGGHILITTPNVKTFHAEGEGNPFHFSEMNHAQFTDLMARHFTDFRVQGIGYPRPNWIRSMAHRMPFYREIGLLLKRGSRIKSMAARAMQATDYSVLEDHVARDAVDLLAVCVNDRSAT